MTKGFAFVHIPRSLNENFCVSAKTVGIVDERIKDVSYLYYTPLSFLQFCHKLPLCILHLNHILFFTSIGTELRLIRADNPAAKRLP